MSDLPDKAVEDFAPYGCVEKCEGLKRALAAGHVQAFTADELREVDAALMASLVGPAGKAAHDKARAALDRMGEG